MPAIESITPVLPVEAIEPCLPLWNELGFEIVMQVPHGDAIGFAILVRDGVMFMYQTWASVAEDFPPAAPLVRGQVGHMYVKVADIDDIERRLGDYPIFMERRTTFYGSTEIGVRDAGGHVVVFAQFAEEATS